jgi:hypothetical protein
MLRAESLIGDHEGAGNSPRIIAARAEQAAGRRRADRLRSASFLGKTLAPPQRAFSFVQ